MMTMSRTNAQPMTAALRAAVMMNASQAMSAAEFSNLVNECMPRLRAYARALARSVDKADDLVQDALLRAWASRAQFAEGTNFHAWLFTILRNRFLDQRRRDRGGEWPIDESILSTVACGPSQDTVIYFDDMARAYWRLSAHHREILMLVGAIGLGYEEAADVLGCAVGTVRSRLSRARTELQSVLDGGRQGGDRSTQPGAAEFLQVLGAA